MNHEILPMFVAMFIAGILTTMNLYVDKLSDMRLSLNDIYMSLTMCGWMFLLSGLYYKMFEQIILGLILLVFGLFCIRTQFLINPYEYLLGMIPHHSMAVKISKNLLSNQNPNKELIELANNIIISQENEINLMKKMYL